LGSKNGKKITKYFIGKLTGNSNRNLFESKAKMLPVSAKLREGKPLPFGFGRG
jgi:hypothetical protein